MVKREIVEIDGKKCNGCGLCIPHCQEGALQIVGGKAKLVGSVYCDGLGNCLGKCPRDAIRIVEKDVAAFDESKVSARLKRLGGTEAHAVSGKDGPPCKCPGSAARNGGSLGQWPIQLALLPPDAPFFRGSRLLVCADCVAFACGSFREKFFDGGPIAIGCPKLDDVNAYKKKLADIFRVNPIKSVLVAVMEVPCCQGLYAAVECAAVACGRKVSIKKAVVGLSGEPA